MAMTGIGPIMPGMSKPEIINGHTPSLTATIPAVAWPQQVAAPTLGGGEDPRRSSAQPVQPVQLPAAARVKKIKSGSWVQNLLTALATLIAMAGSASGMWKLFGDVLHIDNLYVRGSLFAVFEIALLSSALRARSYRIEFNASSIDDKAVWAIATTTGVLASLDETTLAGRLIRIALPLTAAFLFERLITTERRKREVLEGGKIRKTIHWAISPTRILVKLGLADAEGRDVADIDLTRRMAKLATLAYRAHSAGRWSKGRAQTRYQRALAKANERYGLSTNAKAMEQFRASVALLNGAISATTAEAVETASPWTRATIRETKEQATLQGRPRPAAAPRRQVTEDVREAVRPHNPNHDREVVKTPTAKVGRTAEENWALIGQHLETNPDASRTELASVLGISRTRVGQIFDLFAPKTAN
jgi:hypothetical protein